MRNFIVKYGSFIVDIAAVFTLIGVIISTFKVTVAQGFIAGLGVFWAGLVSFIFVFFLIYLTMSINEHLEHIQNMNNRY